MSVALNERLIRSIRDELVAQDVSARELARRMGVAQTYLQDRLKGRVEFRPSDLEDIANALGVPVDMFISDQPGAGDSAPAGAAASPTAAADPAGDAGGGSPA